MQACTIVLWRTIGSRPAPEHLCGALWGRSAELKVPGSTREQRPHGPCFGGALQRPPPLPPLPLRPCGKGQLCQLHALSDDMPLSCIACTVSTHRWDAAGRFVAWHIREPRCAPTTRKQAAGDVRQHTLLLCAACWCGDHSDGRQGVQGQAWLPPSAPCPC